MKKVSIFLVLMMIVSLFVSACGSKTGGSTDNKSEETSAPGENASNEEQITLQFMGWEVSPLETESVKKGLELFEKQNPNIKVEYTTIPGGTQYISKLQAMMIGEEAPDVFFIQSDYYRDFVKQGSLLNITDKVENDFNVDDFIPSALQISQVDGEFYGIEACTVSPVLYYNKTLFENANLPFPPSDPSKAWTWDEFVDVAKQLTIKNGDQVEQYGVYGFEDYYMTIAEVISNGGNWFSDDYSKSTANTPEVKEVLKAIYDLRTVHGVSPETKLLQNSGMSPNQMLQTGKIAMLINGSWGLQEVANMNFEVGVGVLPKFKDAVTHGQAHLHAAWSKTKHPEAAWKLIKFLSSEEYQLQNVREGLWMPNRKSLYTEEGIEKWHNPDVHPEGFKELAPYFINAEVYPYAVLGNKEIQQTQVEELDKYFYGGQSLEDTVKNMETRVNLLLKEQ